LEFIVQSNIFSKSLQITDNSDILLSQVKDHAYKYPSMTKTLGNFKLHIEEGSFTNNEIIVLLGENGCGKTTLIRMLTGDKRMKPDESDVEVYKYNLTIIKIPELSVSYKPQTISPTFQGTVEELLQNKLGEVQLFSHVLRYSHINHLLLMLSSH